MKNRFSKAPVCLYMQALQKVSSRLPNSDKDLLSYEAKNNKELFLKNFFTDDFLEDLGAQMKILKDDYSNEPMNPSSLEIAFLEKIVPIVFLFEESEQFQKIEEVFLKDDLYPHLLQNITRRIVYEIMHDYEWFEENIFCDHFPDLCNEMLYGLPYLRSAEEKQLIKVSEISQDYAKAYRYLFRKII